MSKVLSVLPCSHCGQTVIKMPIKHDIHRNTRLSVHDMKRFVHRRGMRGDVETWALTKEEAITMFRHFGFDANDSNVSVGRYGPVVAATDSERSKVTT